MKEKPDRIEGGSFTICFLFILLLFGCDITDHIVDTFDKMEPMVQPPPPIEMRLELSDHVLPKYNPLRMTLEVTNTGDSAVRITSPGILEQENIYYDFIVTRPDSLQVWDRKTGDLTFVWQAWTGWTLNAGESVVFEHEWDQENLNDQQVGRGTYMVYGALDLDYTDPETSERVKGTFATKLDTILIK